VRFWPALLVSVAACAGEGPLDDDPGGKTDDPDGASCETDCDCLRECVVAGGDPAACVAANRGCESAEEAAARKERVAGRRAGRFILAHRGSWELAHENTLEAYRATMELGADGNEIDIRRTADGVLVCFHDDMLDMTLRAFGDVDEFDWADLERVPFRQPGRFGPFTRVPALVEVLLLHREHAGLLQLDIKRPGQDEAIAGLLEALDMWEHVVLANPSNADAVANHPAYVPHGKPARNLTEDRRDMDPAAIEAALADGAEVLFVDDPRLSILALGRAIGTPSSEPVRPVRVTEAPAVASEVELLAILADDAGWDVIPEGAAAEAEAAARIGARARAAEELGVGGFDSADVRTALEERIARRALHGDWRFHGLDGSAALRVLAELGFASAAERARFVIWRVDPALEPLSGPAADWRMKWTAWQALDRVGGDGAAAVARDYLALETAEAEALGWVFRDEPARVLMRADPSEETAAALLADPRPVVRARALLELARLEADWVEPLLAELAPFALEIRLPGS
jgi:hypothetical protein